MENSYMRHEITRLKVIVVGDIAVGKTCLAHRFVKNTFRTEHVVTISDIETKTVTIKNKPVLFQIWDTAGQERYRSLLPMYMKGIDGAVVVYDVTQQESFESVKAWIAEIRKHGPDDAVISLVGNKLDLAREDDRNRAVKDCIASAFAKFNGLSFVEASAKTGENVDTVFTELGQLILDRNKTSVSIDYTKVCADTDSPKKSSSCCR